MGPLPVDLIAIDGRDEQRRGQQQCEHGEAEVEGTLLNALCPFVLRLFDMQQRESRDRPHGQSCSGDIHHAGRHHQVDVHGLELPHQLSDTAHPEMFGARYRYGVGPAVAQGGHRFGFVTENRDFAALQP